MNEPGNVRPQLTRGRRCQDGRVTEQRRDCRCTRIGRVASAVGIRRGRSVMVHRAMCIWPVHARTLNGVRGMRTGADRQRRDRHRHEL